MNPAAPHVYRWRGLDAQGRMQNGTLQALNRPLAQAQLRREGITVHALERQWWSRNNRIPAGQLTALTRQWATLIKAGVSLVPALQMLERSAPSQTLAELLHGLRQDVESGVPLSKAMARHPEHFSSLYVNMVQAGESAGILDKMMDRLARTLEKNDVLRARVRTALTYPAVVIVIAIGVLALILLQIVPVFEEVFSAFGAQLPWPTQLVLGLSHALSAAPLWLAMAMLGLTLLIHKPWRNPAWRRAWSRRTLRLPYLGPMLRTSVLARWAHTLSALLAVGVPLNEALSTAGQACAHPVYTRINEHLQRRVAQGGRLSEGMAHTGRFPDMLVQLCATGEETGTLDTLLAQAAELMTQELELQVQTLSSFLEPLIVVALGLVIGGILVAVYLPVFRLGQVF